MKKYIICLAFVLLFSSLVSLPVADKNKKPIVVDKMCYAQEIVEYEGEEVVEETNPSTQETQDQCDNCVCVWVRGESKITKSPDSAKIYATIETLDSDMTKSKEDNFSTFDEVVSALKKAGLTEDDITLEHFSCHASYDYAAGRNLLGYQSCTSFCVKANNIENIKEYIDILTENGASSIFNNEMLDDICMTLGGRAAEALVVKDVTQGASGDLRMVTNTARRMITQYGMSEELGLVAYDSDQPVFVGMEYGHSDKTYSQETAAKIDAEVRRIISEAYDRALALLKENRSILDNMSRVLVEKETIYTEEVEMLMAGKDYKEVVAYMETQDGDRRVNSMLKKDEEEPAKEAEEKKEE